MKPKLLIAMGDSNTAGVGCWRADIVDTSPTNYSTHLDRFLRLGWPALLQTKLNYNHLINLGMGGSSDSHQLKSFIENITAEELKKYDVLVIWMMTYPGRFSFYSDGIVKSVMSTGNHIDSSINNLAKSYLNFIQDTTKDCALEQLYHIRLFNKFCQGNNINFLFATLDNMQREFLYKNCGEYFDIDNNLDSYMEIDSLGVRSIYPNLHIRPELKSRICMHPNENGYEVIANNIFSIVKNNFSYLINDTEKVEFRLESRMVKQW